MTTKQVTGTIAARRAQPPVARYQVPPRPLEGAFGQAAATGMAGDRRRWVRSAMRVASPTVSPGRGRSDAGSATQASPEGLADPGRRGSGPVTLTGPGREL